jgi:RNA polymerase sigma factor (sigma-70 family)
MPTPLDDTVTEYRENGNVLSENICAVLEPVLWWHARKILSGVDWRRIDNQELLHDGLIYSTKIFARYRIVTGVPFSAYYHRAIHWWMIGWNTVYNRGHRSKKTHVSFIPHDLIPVDLNPTPDHSEEVALKELLEKLSPRDRDLILLVAVHSYKFEEIAQRTGYSRGSIYEAYRSALRRAQALALQGKPPKSNRRHPRYNPYLHTPMRRYELPDHTPSPDLDTPCSPDRLSSHALRILRLDNHPDEIECSL